MNVRVPFMNLSVAWAHHGIRPIEVGKQARGTRETCGFAARTRDETGYQLGGSFETEVCRKFHSFIFDFCLFVFSFNGKFNGEISGGGGISPASVSYLIRVLHELSIWGIFNRIRENNLFIQGYIVENFC